jgi:hypothetical protein
LDEYGAHRIIECTKNKFSLTVLWVGVWTGEEKNNVVRSKVTMHGVVNKLSAVISLKALNGMTKLCTSKSNKINNVLMHLRLALQRIRPAKLRRIIQQN